MDVLHYHRQVPTCAHDRHFDLGQVAEARANAKVRISWSLLFIKAFGLVAQRVPVLRQTYFRWPIPHLYQHHESVAVMATHREFRGEPWLFWSRFPCPERSGLVDLQSHLHRCQTERPEKCFRQQLQLSMLPLIPRRLFWWWTLNVSGGKRAKRSGTFFLSTLASQQTEIQHPPAFLTSNLTYGPLDSAGRARVTLAYDHRLMDGYLIARVLQELESTLTGTILAELQSLNSRQMAA
jgi:hypothetical protein